MTFKKTTTLQLRLVETLEIVDDEKDTPPSLPPFPVVETTGSTVSETTRPLAKVFPLVEKLRRLG